MWKIWNKLFGWDYIYWSNSSDQGVARIHKDYDEGCFYWRYKSTELADRVTMKRQVIWLTCSPDKYLLS